MRSACLDEYQHAVVWHDDLFLFGGNGRILILAQGFFDLLFDLQKGACCVYYLLYGWGVSFCSIRHSVVQMCIRDRCRSLPGPARLHPARA